MVAMSPEGNEGVTKMLKRSEVAAFLDLQPSTIKTLVRQGRFPRPVRLSHQIVRWPSKVLNDWIAAGCPPQK